MNGAARAQLTFQMSTLLQKYIIRTREQCVPDMIRLNIAAWNSCVYVSSVQLLYVIKENIETKIWFYKRLLEIVNQSP